MNGIGKPNRKFSPFPQVVHEFTSKQEFRKTEIHHEPVVAKLGIVEGRQDKTTTRIETKCQIGLSWA